MQPAPPVAVVHLFPELRQHLLSILSGLAEAEWRAPTVCAGWTVKDVALHLLGDEAGNLSRRRDGFADPSFAAPGDDLSEWTNVVAALNRWNERWVQATRRLSPRLLCDLLRVAGAALDDYFQGLDLAAMGAPVGWAGPAPAPVWLDVAREYTERWLHQQHIREAVGRPGLTEPRYLAPVLATFVHALPHTLRDVVAPDGACLRLIIAGDAGGAWQAVRTGGGWALGLAGDEPADATATLDQDTAWRLFTRGLPRERALAAVDRIGDMALAGTVLDMVAIIA